MLSEDDESQDVDKAKDVDKMNKAELMKYAKHILGAETRRIGPGGKNTNIYRSVYGD